MYHFRSFRSKTLLVLYILFGWSAIWVHGGCQRTNPGWISSDEEKDHSTAPLLSFLPGNEFMKQFHFNLEDLNLSVTMLSVCNYLLIVFIGSNLISASWNRSLVSIYNQCYDDIQIWSQAIGKMFFDKYLPNIIVSWDIIFICI